MTALLTATLFPLLISFAAIGDIMTRRIPNWLTFLVAGLFVPVAMMAGLPFDAIGWHLLTGFVALIIGFGLFAAGWFGGGDAKLLAAAALWFGWPDAMRFGIYTALAGGVLALAVAIWCLVQADDEAAGEGWLKKLRKLKPDVPYGVALAAGAFLALPGTWLVTQAA
jgi:prepilin peptidase CpaA